MKKEQMQISNVSVSDQDIAKPRSGEVTMELHGEAALTPEQKQQILNDRARILATETTEEDAREETMRIVEFSLAQERYAVEAIFVGGGLEPLIAVLDDRPLDRPPHAGRSVGPDLIEILRL